MASSYPGSLDAFDSIASDKKTSDVVGGRTHRDMHNDLGDAIEAVQAELGTDPAGSFATVKARLDVLVAYAAKTSAYTATVSDGTLNVTSGTFTLDLPAASTCTGQSLRIRNAGSGVVTLDGNSSETIEGVATFPLGNGSYVEITSTGSAWILTGGVPDTGLRLVAVDGASWSGNVHLRRRGGVVEVKADTSRLTMPAAGTDTVMTLPSGFRAVGNGFTHGLSFNHTTNYVFPMLMSSGGAIYYYATASRSAGNTLSFTLVFTTSNAWPTSLPGSAA